MTQTREVAITAEERDALIAAIEAAELESPEQVADRVLSAGTYEDAMKVLNAAIDADLQPMLGAVISAGPMISGGTDSEARRVAREWIDEGFDTEQGKAWWQAGAFDAYSARCLADAGVSPKQASKDQDGFSLAYRHSNSDMTTDEVVAAVAYPREVAAEVSARRPDLAANDSIAAVLMANPDMTAAEVIESLDEAAEEWRAEQEHQSRLK